MKKLLFILVCIIFASCQKEEIPPIIFQDLVLIGDWFVERVDLINETQTKNVSSLADKCPQKEKIVVKTLDDVVWTSFFTWLDETVPFCSERSEAMKFKLLNNQILVDEFNHEAIVSGELISETELKIYRYHKTTLETKLVFVFRKQ